MLGRVTAGSGSTPHFVAEMVKDATGIAMTIVPFRSGSDGVNAVLANTASATSEASMVVTSRSKRRWASNRARDASPPHCGIRAT